MTNTEPTNQEAGPTPAESVHAAADYARGLGFDPLAVGLDALATQLGYDPAASESAGETESGAHATA